MKSAYLIMAHHQFGLLQKLLELLDDPDNDLYIHIDKKAGDVDLDAIRQSVSRSAVFFTDRISVTWGSYSQIQCELLLLEKAVGRGGYDYYHLLSGSDLPLKTSGEINAFFAAHAGTEYVHFRMDKMDAGALQRVSRYHFFQKHLRSWWLFRALRSLSAGVQTVLRVDRVKNSGIQFATGANWFSITEDLARYVLDDRAFIDKWFRYSRCGDEMFLQTLVLNSDFRGRLAQKDLQKDDYPALKRLIDWERGNPYTFTMADIAELRASDCLFARKFDEDVDSAVIDALYDDLMAKKQTA